jgi:hypothetical protein
MNVADPELGSDARYFLPQDGCQRKRIEARGADDQRTIALELRRVRRIQRQVHRGTDWIPHVRIASVAHHAHYFGGNALLVAVHHPLEVLSYRAVAIEVVFGEGFIHQGDRRLLVVGAEVAALEQVDSHCPYPAG